MPDAAPERNVLVVGARVHALTTTGEPTRTAGAGVAILIRGGRIVSVGAPDELRRAEPAAHVLEFRGATITPGLTDAHAHVVEWALARGEAQLDTAESAESGARLVAQHARARAGEWVRGRGWNPHAWADVPTRALLDRAVPDRPVALQSHDMHALWVNTPALERAGITPETADPDGGRIVRDAQGAPTGILLENAAALVLRHIPSPSQQTALDALAAAQRELHAHGITGVHSVEPDSLAVFEALRGAGGLRLRVLQHLPLYKLEDTIALGLRSGFGSDWIRIGGIKMFLDGALGSRTAWLREPYAGSADCGMSVLPPAQFLAAAQRAAAAGLAATVHAIGDAAVALALAVLARPELRVPALPHRIEHVQLCPPELWPVAARAGIVCSMQPAHLITDWRPAERHWGRERCRGAYAFRSLRDAGAVLALGSDIPVEPVDPRLGLYAASTRQDRSGEPRGGWFPEQRLTVAEALEGYTLGPAHAAGCAGRLGTLAPGAHADLAIWDQDPLDSSGTDLLSLRCRATLVAGEVVWSD